jgi:hypothetical protein
MNVTPHLRRYLSNQMLATLDDVFTGTIADVTEERVRNRFAWERDKNDRPRPVTTVELVVVFENGLRWIPNQNARQALVTWFGTESDNWRGRRVQVIRRRIERIDRESGEVKVRFERIVACPDPHARLPVHAPEVVERETADYDDSDQALARGRQQP